MWYPIQCLWQDVTTYPIIMLECGNWSKLVCRNTTLDLFNKPQTQSQSQSQAYSHNHTIKSWFMAFIIPLSFLQIVWSIMQIRIHTRIVMKQEQTYITQSWNHNHHLQPTTLINYMFTLRFILRVLLVRIQFHKVERVPNDLSIYSCDQINN